MLYTAWSTILSSENADDQNRTPGQEILLQNVVTKGSMLLYNAYWCLSAVGVKGCFYTIPSTHALTKIKIFWLKWYAPDVEICEICFVEWGYSAKLQGRSKVYFYYSSSLNYVYTTPVGVTVMTIIFPGNSETRVPHNHKTA